MLQSHSRDGLSIARGPGTQIVLDGQLRDWIPDFIEDAADAAWDATKDAALYVAHLPVYAKNAATWLARQTCDATLDDDVLKYIVYLRESILLLSAAASVPGPQQAVTVSALAAAGATLAVYEAAAQMCGLVLPRPPPPIPGPTPPSGPGANNPGKVPMSRSILFRNIALTSSPKEAASASGSSLFQNLNAEAPWYKRGSTYAAAGGLVAAIGAAYYFARVRR